MDTGDQDSSYGHDATWQRAAVNKGMVVGRPLRVLVSLGRNNKRECAIGVLKLRSRRTSRVIGSTVKVFCSQLHLRLRLPQTFWSTLTLTFQPTASYTSTAEQSPHLPPSSNSTQPIWQDIRGVEEGEEEEQQEYEDDDRSSPPSLAGDSEVMLSRDRKSVV